MKEKIRSIVAEILAYDAERLSDDTDFSQLPNWSSIKQLAIVSEAEEAFDAILPLERIARFNTIDSLAEAVAKSR